MNRYLLAFFGIVALCLLGLSPIGAQEEKVAPYADKLQHAPTPVPDRIILTWSDDPKTTQSVTWRTDTSVKVSQAQVAPSTDGSEFDPYSSKGPKLPEGQVRTFQAKTTYLKSDLNEAHYHSVTFTELKPKSRYVYRVGDGTNWSEWFQFDTVSDQPEPFGFVYFGDAQNDLKRHWSRVVRGSYSDMPKARFFLHAGDLINKSNADAEWGDWHKAAGWINGMIPSIATPGNHEYGTNPKTENEPAKRGVSVHWKPQFTLPENGPKGFEETCYYLDIQGVRIISLNSNEDPEPQSEWLKGVLKNNPNRWTVVTFHHPVYSTAKKRDNKKIRETWRPIFDEYAVDLVLQGHDHTYGRSGLMREDNLLDGAQAMTSKGTVYCVSVSGPKMYELGDLKWAVKTAANVQLYQLINIDGGKLHYEARTAAGKLYDEFELRKREGQGNLLVERKQLDEERKANSEPEPTRNDALIGVAALLAAAMIFGIVRFVQVNLLAG